MVKAMNGRGKARAVPVGGATGIAEVLCLAMKGETEMEIGKSLMELSLAELDRLLDGSDCHECGESMESEACCSNRLTFTVMDCGIGTGAISKRVYRSFTTMTPEYSGNVLCVWFDGEYKLFACGEDVEEAMSEVNRYYHDCYRRVPSQVSLLANYYTAYNGQVSR